MTEAILKRGETFVAKVTHNEGGRSATIVGKNLDQSGYIFHVPGEGSAVLTETHSGSQRVELRPGEQVEIFGGVLVHQAREPLMVRLKDKIRSLASFAH